MITPWQIYWITRLDGVKDISIVLGVLLIIIVLVLVWGKLLSEGEMFEQPEMVNRWLRILVIVAALCTIVAVFLPSAKEMAAIILLPKIANNEDMRAIPTDTAKLLRGKLNEWIGDLKNPE